MLTSRQELILNLIVDDYINLATPIASESLARSHALGVSSATIRSEVAALEEQGYISRPHSSAGSIPADKAYRLYVESVLADDTDAIPSPARRAISRQFSDVEYDVDAWGNVAAALLASLAGNMGFATFPKSRECRIRHLELVPVQGSMVMLIVVLEQARLRKQLVRMEDSVEASHLETITQRLRSEIIGLTRREIEAKSMRLSPLEQNLVEATVLVLKDEDFSTGDGSYVDGLRNLVSQPEFVDPDKLRAIVQGVEDGSLVEAILAEEPDGSVIQVIIGHEHTGDVLWPLSVVICRYGIPGEVDGTVGAVGPTRMAYTKAISGVKFVASVMNRLVEGAYGG